MVDFFTNITDGTELMLLVKILLLILVKWYYGICRDFEIVYFEMRSLFFSLMKRTKNQGCGIVVEAQISIFS
jgi:hypothetical protein